MTRLIKDPIAYAKIISDSLFISKQLINLLTIPNNACDGFQLKFSYSNSDLIPTSSFGESNQALAAINGSFFNMDSGGSVTYYELSKQESAVLVSGPLLLLNSEFVNSPSDRSGERPVANAILVTQ